MVTMNDVIVAVKKAIDKNLEFKKEVGEFIGFEDETYGPISICPSYVVSDCSNIITSTYSIWHHYNNNNIPKQLHILTNKGEFNINITEEDYLNFKLLVKLVEKHLEEIGISEFENFIKENKHKLATINDLDNEDD